MFACVQKKNRHSIVFGTSKKTLVHSGDFHCFKFSVCAGSNLLPPGHLGDAKPQVQEGVYIFNFLLGAFDLEPGELKYQSPGGWLTIVNTSAISASSQELGENYAIDMSLENLETVLTSDIPAKPTPYAV